MPRLWARDAAFPRGARLSLLRPRRAPPSRGSCVRPLVVTRPALACASGAPFRVRYILYSALEVWGWQIAITLALP